MDERHQPRWASKLSLGSSRTHYPLRWGCRYRLAPLAGRDVLPSGRGATQSGLSDEKVGTQKHAPTLQQVKCIAAFVKKVLSSKKRRDVVTTVLKWVVMVTTALLNAVTVAQHLG